VIDASVTEAAASVEWQALDQQQTVAVVKLDDHTSSSVTASSSHLSSSHLNSPHLNSPHLPAFILASSLPSAIAVVTSPDPSLFFHRQDVIGAASRTVTPAKCMYQLCAFVCRSSNSAVVAAAGICHSVVVRHSGSIIRLTLVCNQAN